MNINPYLPKIVSAVYFVTCAIYFFYGLIIIRYNTKSTINRLFFFCCLDMALWSFSFSIGNVASNYESALLWRRIASGGWGVLFSYFLHYILLLTENRLLKKRFTYALIYVPAIINILLYGVYTKTAVRSYNLVFIDTGWINIAGNTALDWYYNIYYIGFSLIGIILLLHSGFTLKNERKRKQSILIGFSFIVAVIAGTMTEYIINRVFQMKVPQLAPVIILLPLSAMLYCIRTCGLMRDEAISKEPEDHQIISEYAKSRLYFRLSLAYIIGGFLNFAVQFFTMNGQAGETILISSIIFFFGLAVSFVRSLKIKPEYKQLLSNIIFVVSIPMLTLKYINTSAIYAWVVPVLLMLVAISLNEKQLLLLIGLATLATLVIIWVKAPVLTVTFSNSDHIYRLIILTAIMWFVFCINRIYVGAIDLNREKIKQEKLLNQVSNLLVSASEINIDNKLVEAMALCGKHFKLDQIIVAFRPMSIASAELALYQWYSSEKDAMEHVCEKSMLEAILSLADSNKLEAEGRLMISGYEKSEEDELLENLPESVGMKSLVLKPLRDKSKAIGALCLGSAGRFMIWEKQQQEITNLLAHLITDLWTKVEAERELFYQANYDILTGLPNRTTFLNRLSQAIEAAERSNKLVGVIFIDMDTFKAVNDSIGHDSGDSVLVQIGKLLQECMSPSIILARFGGDEFLIMIPQMETIDAAQSVAEKITEIFQRAFVVKDQEFHITASVGIAVYPYDGVNTEALIKNADLAMYKSKQLGKNRYTFCTDEIKEETLRKIRLKEDLFRALDRQELKLLYQPQVSARSKKIIGFEALLRWIHPEFGVIYPNLFIPLAEQTGLIGPIGDWVLRTACLQCRSLQLIGLMDISIAVNVSVIQLRNPGFVYSVKQILEETKLEPSYLELEVTEGTAISESSYIIEVLNSLKKLGIQISIDDFGTEYSSLSRLCALPIDNIKLDMQFVSGIGRGEKENAIIDGIIGLAHSLGLKVIAEGVETQLQLDYLSRRGCDIIQGFFYYRPLPSEELEEILLQE